MKKLYLLLLVFLLLFIPATNAVTPYQLDHPIKELNNHTLREVFDNNIIAENVSYIDVYRVPFSNIDPYLGNENDYYYYAGIINMISHNGANSAVLQYFVMTLEPNIDVYAIGVHNFSFKLQFTGSNSYRVRQDSGTSTYDLITHYQINMTDLGIENLTVEQMDMYYDYYLKAVQFEIDYYEVGLDPGEYQHIFKSILNGVKNLISEMGYVWQWLNAPIITTDMQDYSFNIDWSWDLIGVIRQIMNSAGILTLQIAFWVPSLAFAFMGIPVQISVLSLLFSNLIFLLLGWILVKSLLI